LGGYKFKRVQADLLKKSKTRLFHVRYNIRF